MNFEQLEAFLAAAESRTFFDAAESLHISQSALSKQILKLEKELNTVLFDRSRRSAELTEAGIIFLQEARELHTRYLTMLERMQEFSRSSAMSLNIGTLPVLSQYGITGTVKQFSTLHPDIHLSLLEAEEPELMSGLDSDRYDLIVARNCMCSSSLHHFFPMAEDRLAVLLPASHPLAGREFITLRELSEETFLLMPPHTALFQLCIQLFHDAGITPRILRTARLESIISAVAFQEGISLSAEKNFELFRHESVVSVPLIPSPSLTVGAIWKKSPPCTRADRKKPLKPALVCFLDFLKNESIQK